MKTKNRLYHTICASALLLTLAASCSQEAPEAALSVTIDGPCKAGQPVCFKFDGTPDNIVFYSGEPGHEYALRDRLYADNDLMVDFVSYTDQSTDVHPNFQVLVSSDFNGVYEPADVAAATWTDVTSLFTLPSVTKQNTPSGSVNLKEYAGADNDALLYIAFRYHDLDGVAVRNRWVVRSINIDKVSPEGVSSSLATIKTAGWQNVIMSGNGKWTLPGSQLLAAGNVSTNDKDMWAISAGFDVHSSTPSTGIALKNIATDMSEYRYTYENPGVYEAVFATSSVWYNSENTSLTSVTVTVTE